MPVTSDTAAEDHHSPACPGIPPFGVVEDDCIGLSEHQRKAVSLGPVPTKSEFDCLNLVITAPQLESQQVGKLPILFWIHGGGREWGSNANWCADGGVLVARGLATEKPLIVVSPNYRLGAFGWMTSAALHPDRNSKHTQGNWALRDLDLALEWTCKHIAEFGGDSEQITIAGESAGGVNVIDLLISDLTPRWSRAIAHSQGPLISQPRDLSVKEDMMQQLIQHAGVNSVKELAEKDSQCLLTAYLQCDHRVWESTCPVYDEVMPQRHGKTSMTWAPWSKKEVLLCDTLNDGCLWLFACAVGARDSDPTSAKDCLQWFRQELGNDLTDQLVRLFDLSDEVPLPDLARVLVRILGLNNFQSHSHDIAQKAQDAGATVYRFTFDKIGPWTGIMEGAAPHAADLAYLFGNPQLFSHLTPAEQRSEIATLQGMQDRWIAYVRGEKPWTAQKQDRFLNVDAHGHFNELSMSDLHRKRESEKFGFFLDLPFDVQMHLDWTCTAALRGLLKALQWQPLFT